jgi:uronate dehydrogenase
LSELIDRATSDGRPLLLTGAAGWLGRHLRPHLVKRAGGLRSSDILDFGPALPNEEIVQADLADAAAVDRLVSGVGAIVHFGGIRIEDSFDRILQANIVGTFNVLEAARRHEVKRVVYASSVHAIGYYPSSQTIDSDVPHRPDGFYGVSKAFAEDLARLYVDKAGMEIACLRIGTVLQEPRVPRHLSTYLSFSDLYRLVDACLDQPKLGFAVVYGNSDNRRSWWDNSKSGVDYRPQDDSETFADRFAGYPAPDPEDPAAKFQGGPFIPLDFGERPVDVGERPKDRAASEGGAHKGG